MKFSGAFAAAALLGVASARSVLVEESEAVQPIQFSNCGKPSDSAVVEKIELSPNPPQLGKNLNVKVTGELKKDLEKGAKLSLKLGAGAIPLLNKDFDLCGTIDEYKDKLSGKDSLVCPIKAAKKTWEQIVALPNLSIPALARKLNANLVIKNKDGSQVVCQDIEWPLK